MDGDTVGGGNKWCTCKVGKFFKETHNHFSRKTKSYLTPVLFCCALIYTVRKRKGKRKKENDHLSLDLPPLSAWSRGSVVWASWDPVSPARRAGGSLHAGPQSTHWGSQQWGSIEAVLEWIWFDWIGLDLIWFDWLEFLIKQRREESSGVVVEDKNVYCTYTHSHTHSHIQTPTHTHTHTWV